MRHIHIATRTSPLAMWQAGHVRDALIRRYPRLEVDIVGLSTTGDRLPGRGDDKSRFTREIEQALLAGEVHAAVHSMKDVALSMPDGLVIGAVLERGDARDAFVSERYSSLAELPEGAVIGTGSPRRRGLLLSMGAAAFRVAAVSGNVGTRIRKMADGQCDALILAAAGLHRLNLSERIREYLPPDRFVPAISQAAVGVQIRADDKNLRNMLSAIDDKDTDTAVRAERAFGSFLQADCHQPVAAYAVLRGERLTLTGMIADPANGRRMDACADGAASMPEELGQTVAERLLRDGGEALLESVRRSAREY